jgi:hypothetical protein
LYSCLYATHKKIQRAGEDAGATKGGPPSSGRSGTFELRCIGWMIGGVAAGLPAGRQAQFRDETRDAENAHAFVPLREKAGRDYLSVGMTLWKP